MAVAPADERSSCVSEPNAYDSRDHADISCRDLPAVAVAGSRPRKGRESKPQGDRAPDEQEDVRDDDRPTEIPTVNVRRQEVGDWFGQWWELAGSQQIEDQEDS